MLAVELLLAWVNQMQSLTIKLFRMELFDPMRVGWVRLAGSIFLFRLFDFILNIKALHVLVMYCYNNDSQSGGKLTQTFSKSFDFELFNLFGR